MESDFLRIHNWSGGLQKYDLMHLEFFVADKFSSLCMYPIKCTPEREKLRQYSVLSWRNTWDSVTKEGGQKLQFLAFWEKNFEPEKKI